MGSRRFETVLAVLVVVATLCGGATAQTINGACMTALTSLAPCLNYTTGSSPAPSSSCCSQLAGVVRTSPQCLCAVVNGPIPSIGVNINRTLALQLPGACKVQAPPLTQCNAANGPTASSPTSPTVDSPASSPADETPGAATTPAASDTPSSGTGGGSKTVPSTNGGSSHGNVAGAPVNLVLFVISIISIISKF